MPYMLATQTIDTEVLTQIVKKTDSALVLFFVIAAIAAVPVCYYLYKHAKHRHAVECSRREQDLQREKNIIHVVSSNTEIMAGLKVTLETNNLAIMRTVDRIHDRIDESNTTLKEVSANIARISERSAKPGKPAKPTGHNQTH